MTDLTLHDMYLTITIDKIKANKNYVYPSLLIPLKIRSNPVSSPASPQDAHRQIGIIFTNMIMKASLTGKAENREDLAIGYARPESLEWEIKPSVTEIDFVLILDHYILSQIEKFRKGDNLYLQLDLRVQGYALEKPGAIRESVLSQQKITVSKSDWVEEILPELNYKHVTLIEVPALDSKDFISVIAEVDKAWKDYSMGDYKQVLVHCRSALDGIATKVREAGYKIQDNEEEYQCPNCGHTWSKSNVEKEIRTVPNWKTFFDDNKIGHNVREIYRSARAFTSPGAHFGKTFGMEEANLVLFQTYSIVKYILSRFEELKP